MEDIEKDRIEEDNVEYEVEIEAENDQTNWKKRMDNVEERWKELQDALNNSLEDSLSYVRYFLTKEWKREYDEVWFSRYIKNIASLEEDWEDIEVFKKLMARIILLMQSGQMTVDVKRDRKQEKISSKQIRENEKEIIEFYEDRLNVIWNGNRPQSINTMKYAIDALVEIAKFDWDILEHTKKLLNQKRY